MQARRLALLLLRRPPSPALPPLYLSEWELSLLLQVLYPVCTPRPAQTELRPEVIHAGPSACPGALVRHLTPSPLHSFSPSTLLPLLLTRWERGRFLLCRWVAPGARVCFPRSSRVLGLPPPRPGSAEPEPRGRLHFGSSGSPGRHDVFFPAAVRRSPAFSPHLSGGFPLTEVYLAARFWGLEMLLFPQGPRSQLRSVALGVQLHRLQATPPSITH
ncbi:hypothetical protein NDU88_005330 [Pleurodeles waltl]|uniref:Uncharacterized protein n=1 Tax=Pleurodeles waltl TaxID=8319 RepID=A0AAV7TC78_PLEWA|nr:hypothetical protein NDU88_005330 [Pleurodeles waltl]